MDALIFMVITLVMVLRNEFGSEPKSAEDAVELTDTVDRKVCVNATGYHDTEAFMYIFKHFYGEGS